MQKGKALTPLVQCAISIKKTNLFQKVVGSPYSCVDASPSRQRARDLQNRDSRRREIALVAGHGWKKRERKKCAELFLASWASTVIKKEKTEISGTRGRSGNSVARALLLIAGRKEKKNGERCGWKTKPGNCENKTKIRSQSLRSAELREKQNRD